MAFQYNGVFQASADVLNRALADANWRVNENEPVTQIDGEVAQKQWAIEDREGTVLHFGTMDFRSFRDNSAPVAQIDGGLYLFLTINYDAIKESTAGVGLLSIVDVDNSRDVPAVNLHTEGYENRVFAAKLVTDADGNVYVYSLSESGASTQAKHGEILAEAQAMA